MDERPARAMLVSAADIGEGLTTAVSRSEIEEVLGSDGEPIELVLDVTRFSNGEAGPSNSVAISWERSELERLLEQATGEKVELTFDPEALQRALVGDVEAHGMREAVVALAVAATAATGAAAQASADPGPPFLESGTAVSQVAGDLAPDDRAVPRPTPVVASAPDLAPDDRAVPRPTPVAVSAPDLAPDDRAVPRPTPWPSPPRTWLPTTAPRRGLRRWRRLPRTWLRTTARCRGRSRWSPHRWRRLLLIWLRMTGRYHGPRRFHRRLQARCRTGHHGRPARPRRRFSPVHSRSRSPARSSSSAVGGFARARRRTRPTERRLSRTALRTGQPWRVR